MDTTCSYFELFRYDKYEVFWSKKLIKTWYLLGIFELFMIFQDLGNMVCGAVDLAQWYSTKQLLDIRSGIIEPNKRLMDSAKW